MTKARSQRAAGISKAVSEPVYPGDILSEPGWQLGSIGLRGAWAHTLLEMWRENVATIERSATQWARAWNVTEAEAMRIIGEMEQPPYICEVRRRAGSDLVAPIVALTCRRLMRRRKVLARKAKNKRDERAKAALSPACRPPVAATVVPLSEPPSSSSSSSSSSSPSSSGVVGVPEAPGQGQGKEPSEEPEISIPALAEDASTGDCVRWLLASHAGFKACPETALAAIVQKYAADKARRAAAINEFLLHYAGNAGVERGTIWGRLDGYLRTRCESLVADTRPVFHSSVT